MDKQPLLKWPDRRRLNQKRFSGHVELHDRVRHRLCATLVLGLVEAFNDWIRDGVFR